MVRDCPWCGLRDAPMQHLALDLSADGRDSSSRYWSVLFVPGLRRCRHDRARPRRTTAHAELLTGVVPPTAPMLRSRTCRPPSARTTKTRSGSSRPSERMQPMSMRKRGGARCSTRPACSRNLFEIPAELPARPSQGQRTSPSRLVEPLPARPPRRSTARSEGGECPDNPAPRALDEPCLLAAGCTFSARARRSSPGGVAPAARRGSPSASTRSDASTPAPGWCGSPRTSSRIRSRATAADHIDGETIEAVFDPLELDDGLAFRESIPPDLMALLRGWTLGFCPLNAIERSVSDLIDARGSSPVSARLRSSRRRMRSRCSSRATS